MTDFSYLQSIVFMFLIAVLVVATFVRFNLSPVLGYFVAGAAIGQHGWITNYVPGLKFLGGSETKVWAEFGVVFLLFSIGLELTLERLKSMKTYVFGVGGLQVLLTGSIISSIVHITGWTSFSGALVIGFGVAMSSTAVVMQVLIDQKRQSSQPGRLSLAVLLMQDLAVVPLLVLTPLLGHAASKSAALKLIGTVLFKAILGLTGILIAGRLLLRPLFRLISSNKSSGNELFVATTILIVLGAAWTTDHLGLSLELGAFIAGLLVAETEFHLKAEESILPFKGLFLGLFFMTVGMSFKFDLLLANFSHVMSLSLGLIAIKALIIVALCFLFKFSASSAVHVGLLLAQGGEFAFIIFNIAMENGVISHDMGHILLMVVTTTMALTPLLSAIGGAIAKRIEEAQHQNQWYAVQESADLNAHVIVIGFGRVGKMTAQMLEMEKVPYVVLDTNPTKVALERRNGFPIYVGNGWNAEDLSMAGIERARLVIVAIDSELMVKKCVRSMREQTGSVPIVVRTKDLSKENYMYKIGVTALVPETYETGLQLGAVGLRSIGIDEQEVDRLKHRFRKGKYSSATEAC